MRPIIGLAFYLLVAPLQTQTKRRIAQIRSVIAESKLPKPEKEKPMALP
jgi:hypothetical protein